MTNTELQVLIGCVVFFVTHSGYAVALKTEKMVGIKPIYPHVFCIFLNCVFVVVAAFLYELFFETIVMVVVCMCGSAIWLFEALDNTRFRKITRIATVGVFLVMLILIYQLIWG